MNSITELELNYQDLNEFPDWGKNNDASDTKTSSKNTESWVKKCFVKNFPDLEVFRTGPQTDPDFYLVKKSHYLEILKHLGTLYDKDKKIREKPTKGEFLKAVSQLKKLRGLLILFIELSIKSTTKTTYRTNRHPPLYGSKKVYINFSGTKRCVYVAIAHDIACRSAKTPEAHNIPLLIEQKRREFVLWARGLYIDHFDGQRYLDSQPNRNASIEIMDVNSNINDLDKIFNDVRFQVESTTSDISNPFFS